jgi:hypothetical protein
VPVTLGTEHSVKNLSAKPPLPSAFYRALGKALAKREMKKYEKKTLKNLF